MRITAGGMAGSGFIFDTESTTAFVITNHHVIEDERSIDVRANSRTYRATLLGYDSGKDIAVVAICCSQDFVKITWESELPPEIGTVVVAIGYTRASSSKVTATTGKVTENQYFSVDEAHVIWHDAPLNPGNSGGPLFTMSEKVLGVNTGNSRFRPGISGAVSYQSMVELLPEWRSKLVVAPEKTPTPTPAPTGTETPPATPMPTDTSHLTVSGQGTNVEFLDLPAGQWIVEMEVSGSYDSIRIRIGDDLVADPYGDTWSGRSLIVVGDERREIPPGRTAVEVDVAQDATWEVRIVDPPPAIEPSETITGQGWDVKFVNLDEGEWVVDIAVSDNIKCRGSNNRCSETLLDIEIGGDRVVYEVADTWSGRKLVTVGDSYSEIRPGKAAIEVEAASSATWTLEFSRP